MKIHRYTIFIRNDQNHPDIQKKTEFIISTMIKCRVPRNSVRICDITDDHEFQEYLDGVRHSVEYPLLFLWGEFFGGHKEVQDGFMTGILTLAVLNNPHRKHQGKPVGLIRQETEIEKAVIMDDYNHIEEKPDIFKESDIIQEYQNSSDEEVLVDLKSDKIFTQFKNERWISASEWLLRFLSGSLFAPLLSRSSSPLQTIPLLDGDVEFNVIRTNWYWKHQERVIRFSKDKFYRFNETELRESFNYEDVSNVYVNGKNIVVNFSQKSYSQFLECEKVNEFIDELKKHCPDLVVNTV
ncbi:Doublecortin domain-containing protein [Entamoeba marina]